MAGWWWLVVASLVSIVVGDPPLCCPEQPVTPINISCPDGSNFSLNCGDEGMYILSPEHDYYRISENSLLVPSDDNEHVLLNSKFCTALQTREDGVVEVAFVCFNGVDNDERTSKAMIRLYSYCLLVSDVFLFITFLVYCFLPILRDLQGKCVMCFVGSLFIAYLSLAVMQLEFLGITVSKELCIFSGFLTYYWLLCVFFWLYNVSFNIWRGASAANKWPEKTLWIGYLMLGFGGPLLMLTVALITQHIPGDHIKPNFSDRICWFPGRMETWVFFYGPMTVLLVCNIIYFILTAIRLWKDYKITTPQPRIRVLRFKWLLYSKLFLTMGISWIFEIISYVLDANWYVTDILNCLQGFIIFIVMVATRKKVIRAVLGLSLFSSYFTNTWQTIDDEESIDDVNIEQIQLS